MQNKKTNYTYRNIFAPLDLKDYNIDNPTYRSAEHTLLDRTVTEATSSTHHINGKAGIAFLFDKAPAALLRAAYNERGYLGDKDIPYFISLPTGDIVMLPAIEYY